ncbi:MAG: DUF1460 domain-containing protein [Prevotella sp.]|nr:DUF1460 domain-containing protein [Prevotella sp.]
MLKKILLFYILFLCANHPATATQPDYWRSDSVKVMRLLKQASQLDSNTNYMLYFARQLRGLPYVAKTLEKNHDERLVVNLRQLDCTTYTETVLALTLCMKQKKATFDNFCHNLQQLRYKDGIVAYPNRLHYFTSWIEENKKKGLVDCIEEPRGVFTATQIVHANYMTTHVKLYPMLVKHRDWIPLIRNMEKEISGRQYKYIPKSRLNDSALLRQTIHDGDVIVILTSKRGLDTSHIGIAVWHADGLHLLNASQLRHQVVEEPKTFYQYMREHPTHTGIRVVRLR